VPIESDDLIELPIARALIYDDNGFWLMTKRLSKGKFSGWPVSNQPPTAMMAKHLKPLLLV
jgi:transposase